MMDEHSHITVSYGVSVRDAKADLMAVSLHHVVDLVQGSLGDLQHRTSTLRKVIKYSKERYTTMKVGLPFFCCSHFLPAKRRLEYFDRAVGLILDIDWPREVDTSVYDRIKGDPRVYMAYISPSGRGVKVVFGLEAPITDAALYTRYYRWFSHAFAETYHLLDVLDFKNCDATRVSFICHDPKIYINHDPLLLDITAFADRPPAAASNKSTKVATTKVPPDIYKEILHKLGSRPKLRARSEPSVADQVAAVLPLIRKAVEQYDIEIVDVIGLQYGAKLVVQMGTDVAEVNVYHGKKGYSVVTTAKRGTSASLADTARHIIEATIPLRNV